MDLKGNVATLELVANPRAQWKRVNVDMLKLAYVSDDDRKKILEEAKKRDEKRTKKHKDKGKEKLSEELEGGGEAESESNEFEVEEVLDVREVKGKKEYLVRWKGYTPRHDKWVKEADMNAEEAIAEFWRRRALKPRIAKRRAQQVKVIWVPKYVSG
jgi:hypothetical protein